MLWVRVSTTFAVLLLASVLGFYVMAEQIEPGFQLAQAPAKDVKKKSPVEASPPKPEAAASRQLPAVPQPEVLLVMVRGALIALDHANKTNNYTILHGIGGPALQQHSPDRLAQLFSGIRGSKVDLQPTLVLTPQITQAPAVSSDGILTLVGYFPSQPLQIIFQIGYQPVAGVWRLAGLNVSLKPVAAPAPAPSTTEGASAGQKSNQPAKK